MSKKPIKPKENIPFPQPEYDEDIFADGIVLSADLFDDDDTDDSNKSA